MSGGDQGGPAPGQGSQERETGGSSQPCHICVQTVKIFDNGRWLPQSQDPLEQWVNLPREERFVDSGQNPVIQNIDRLTNQVRVRVAHPNPGQGNFEVRLNPNGNNIGYSSDERGRNNKYTFFSQDQSGNPQWVTKPRRGTETEFNVNVDAGGKNQFVVEAKCPICNQTALSRPIKIMRRIWVQPIIMDGLSAPVPNLSSFRQDFERCGLRISERSRAQMPELPCLGTSDEGKQQLLQNAYNAYRDSNAHNLQPYIIALIFVDQIATKRVLRIPVSNFSPAALTINVEDVNTHNRFALWRDMGPEQDWFVSAQFVPDNTVTWGSAFDIDRDQFWTSAHDRSEPEIHSRVHVDADAAIFSVLESRRSGPRPSSAPGSLRLEVNAVEGFDLGYAITQPDSRVNVIVIATRSGWQPVDANEMIGAIIHEMGHKIGMVPDGDSHTNVQSDLDRITTWYNQHQHHGPHCHQGVSTPLPADMRGQNGTCVMFGGTSDNGTNRFCDNCAQCVRKTDISHGFRAFEVSAWTRLTSIF